MTGNCLIGGNSKALRSPAIDVSQQSKVTWRRPFMFAKITCIHSLKLTTWQVCTDWPLKWTECNFLLYKCGFHGKAANSTAQWTLCFTSIHCQPVISPLNCSFIQSKANSADKDDNKAFLFTKAFPQPCLCLIAWVVCVFINYVLQQVSYPLCFFALCLD